MDDLGQPQEVNVKIVVCKVYRDTNIFKDMPNRYLCFTTLYKSYQNNNAKCTAHTAHGIQF